MLGPEPHAEPVPDGPQVSGDALRAWREREGLTITGAVERGKITRNT